jgi:hypothetical protein
VLGALVALAVLVTAAVFALTSGHPGDPAGVDLPAGPGRPAAGRPPATGAGGVPTPAPNDAQAAVPALDPARTVSPAQGPVRLTVRPGRPPGVAGAVYLAYLGWLRGYLDAYARPGRPDRLDRYATPAAAGAVRAQAARLAARGWAEYGSAVLVSASVSVSAGATVRACLDLSGLATRDVAGRLGGRDQPVRCTATLVAAGGRWQVSRDEKEEVPRCR